MPIGSFLRLPFEPAIKLMGKTTYGYKIFILTFFLAFPTFYSINIINNDFNLHEQNLQKATVGLEKSHLLYKMITVLQVLESRGHIYIEGNDGLDQMELEISKNNAVDIQTTLLQTLDDKTKEAYIGYFEKINFSLLSGDSKAFTQQVHIYQHRLLNELAGIKVEYVSTDAFSGSDVAYMLSVELPFGSLLITELKVLRFQKYEKRKLYTKLGELKASINKTDLVLQNFAGYKDHFFELSLKYQRTLHLYTKFLIDKDMQASQEKENSLMQIQFGIFTALQELVKKELLKEKELLDEEINNFRFFVVSLLLVGVYLLVGTYLNFKASMASFTRASRQISQGSLKSRINTDNSDEMGLLSQKFNGMIEELDYNKALFDEYKKAIGSSALIVKTDIDGVITYVNKTFENVSGYSKEELIGSTHRKMRSKSTSYEQLQDLWEHILSNRVYKTVFENIAKNGKSFFVESTIVPILDRKGKLKEFISIMLDITSMYKQKKTLHAQVYKDELTSLPNRLKLIEDISLTQAPKLIIINIDSFQEINSIFGESIGDEALQKTAQVIKDALKSHYLQLYRLSGDEFAILTGKEMSVGHFKDDVAVLSHYLSHTKLHCGEHEISVRLTIGAVISELHLSKRPLISMADMAMKEAKHKTKPYMFYNDLRSDDEDLEKNYKMVQLIEKAIKENKVRCCYQGITNAKTGKIEKYEALMRIDDENGDFIAPSDFISIAKRARYYPKLTQKILQEAVHTFIKREESFSVNLSIDDIMDDNTYSFILEIVRNCGCADRIIFELLESEEIEFNDRLIEFTTKVKALGARISIDDFGSGYSNYAYLVKLGVDILKIDATLIKDLDTDENCRLITQSIIDISHALGMVTIAEHVHSKEIADLVTAMGIDYLQGFYLHKPSCDI